MQKENKMISNEALAIEIKNLGIGLADLKLSIANLSANYITKDVYEIRHAMVAGTTSSTTFKVRGGSHAAGTTSFNGISGIRTLGATTKSSMVITEYKV